MEVKTFTSLDQEFLQAWHDLWAKSPSANYVNCPQWFLSALETFAYQDYVIFGFFKQKRLVGVAALIKIKKLGLDFYSVPPGDYVCGMPFLIDPENDKAVKCLVDALTNLGNIALDNVPEQFLFCLKKYYPKIDYSPEGLNFYMAINQDENGKVFIRKRNDVMRRIRSVQDKFEIKNYTGVTPKVFDIVYSIDINSRKHARGYDTFSNDQMKSFFQVLANHFQENLLINILYFEDKPVAYEMGFIAGTTYFGNQISVLSGYEHYSLGKILLTKELDHLGDMGLTRFNFGSGGNFIKRSFTQEYVTLYKVIISKNILVRKAGKVTFWLKTSLFTHLQRHAQVYSFYRRTKNTFEYKFMKHLQ